MKELLKELNGKHCRIEHFAKQALIKMVEHLIEQQEGLLIKFADGETPTIEDFEEGRHTLSFTVGDPPIIPDETFSGTMEVEKSLHIEEPKKVGRPKKNAKKEG